MTVAAILELKRGERRNKETIPGCCLATVEGMMCLAAAVSRSRKQRMEPLCYCWRTSGSAEQHEPLVMEKRYVFVVLLEEEWGNSGAGTGRGAQLWCCYSKVRQHRAGPVIVDGEMLRRCNGDAESWRWCCRVGG